MLQALERKSQVRTPASADYGVYFVDDDRADRSQELAAPVRGEQQVERLGSRHQDVRRRAQNGGALRLGGVARTDRRRDPRVGKAVTLGVLTNPATRLREILVDIGAQGL